MTFAYALTLTVSLGSVIDRRALLDWNDDRLAFLRNEEIDSLRLI